MRYFPTPCLNFDACFNEANQTQVLSGGSDGSIMLWDCLSKAQDPVAVAKGHDGEVFSVEWSHINKAMVLTGSFDRTAKLWQADKL
jgi:WD40 repeat protein